MTTNVSLLFPQLYLYLFTFYLNITMYKLEEKRNALPDKTMLFSCNWWCHSSSLYLLYQL